MDQTQRLLAEIEAFLPGSGLAATTFGRLAAGDSRFVARIRSGSGMTVRTAERVAVFMRDWQPRKRGKKNG